MAREPDDDGEGEGGDPRIEAAWQALEGGEDYELCFAAPEARHESIAALAAQTGTPIAQIGRIRDGSAIELVLNKSVMQFSPLGFDHFRS